MKTTYLSSLILLIIFSFTLLSCKDKKPHFAVEGKISGADNEMLYLERRSLSNIEIIDSVKLDSDGAFKFEEPSIGYAEFYLLKLNNQAINLAIDSTENLIVNASKEAFATDYAIEGSESSMKIKEIVLAQNKLSRSLNELKKKYDSKELSQEQYIAAVQEGVNEYKNKAKEIVYSDYKSLAAYFAVFQKVDDYLIFDPYDRKDLNLFQGIATVWDQQMSNSPRAEQLKNFTLQTLAEIRQMQNQEETIKKLETTEPTDYAVHYDISLPNLKNEKIRLSSFKGKVVILDFTMYQADFSPAHNMAINSVYEKNKDKVEVYQVSFDRDKHAWQNSVVNLPWICVRDERSVSSELLQKYNLSEFPTTFLINKNGEIVKRLSSKDDLQGEIQKLL
ncbi:MAG: AhpC/TSA family protein [Prevotella sp.]|jgi:peroxiredoxin|nr:AhpC/TSA family protein [Prevotella sp.]